MGYSQICSRRTWEHSWLYQLLRPHFNVWVLLCDESVARVQEESLVEEIHHYRTNCAVSNHFRSYSTTSFYELPLPKHNDLPNSYTKWHDAEDVHRFLQESLYVKKR
ncbi:hypothetical protein C0J52_09071 [Blattella germanica]|nr:hypothetical protein C0J52_09071 [Blattella germanica]